ncbi:MAG: response regulator transcription factor [Rhodospirillaceae bacterium]|nr:response regulator transcription factor [Rhodospirillaceae bacterium]
MVVDDDPRTLRFVRDALTRAGYTALVAGDHSELPETVRAKRPCLVLLDLMLPGADGIELMETVPELADLPVIFISAYGRDETVARALEKGAADYLVKPFSATELTARIQAALRKRAGPETFVLGDLAVHYEERRVTVGGRPVRLTATEFDLLRLLTLNAGRVSTYDSLIRQLWNGPDSGDPDRVRTFVKQLRRKLGDDPAKPKYILNERGVGYRVPKPDE